MKRRAWTLKFALVFAATSGAEDRWPTVLEPPPVVRDVAVGVSNGKASQQPVAPWSEHELLAVLQGLPNTPGGDGQRAEQTPSKSPPAIEPVVIVAESAEDPRKKVPLVQPMPRPGNFALPPQHPGYYSVMDVLRGRFRDKPPRQPMPAFSLIPMSFFDVDYRYLDDPTNTDHDWLDFLKRIRFGDDWLFSTGGEFRYRLMDEAPARLTSINDNYHLIRTRVYGDLWYRDRLRFYLEFHDCHSFGNDLPPRPIDRNPADFLNLFADIKVLERFGLPGYVRIGRQELLYGSQRLISTLDWATTRRTFQGVKAFWKREKWDLDLFWVKPVPPDANRLDWWDLDENFYGLWATYRPKPGTTRDFYVLNLHQNRPVAVGAGGVQGGFYYTTFGSRFAGDRDGRWLYDVEAMAQTGIRANAGVAAFATTVGLGYRAKSLQMTPTAWIYYDYASGTSDPSVNGTSRTFNQLFPFGHYYLGDIDFVGRQNIHNISPQLYFFPAPFVTCQFQYHHFALASARDALYNAAGVPIRQDPTGASGRDVGDEFDFLANFHINRHNDLLFGFSYFIPGTFLRNAAPGTPGTPTLFYLQYSYRW